MPRTEVNGVQLHYHAQGSGTPIVFLHPACIGSRVFTYLHNDLSRDFRTIRFDFRGHGQSGTAPAKVTIPLLVEDTCRLMDALDVPNAYLISYSVASMVALEALLTHPNRFRGAALMSGMAEAEGWRTRTKLKMGGFAGRVGARDFLVFPQLWSNSDNIYTYRRLRGETLHGDIGKWREYMESAMAYSAVSRLPYIDQPVLLLCGERDAESLRHARTLQQGLRNDSTAFLPGRKHTLPTYGGDEAGALIRGWLYALEGREPEAEGLSEDQAADPPLADAGRYMPDPDFPADTDLPSARR
ncbi:alpha/beta fold hydrolase [Cohnella caldifontis]|uniref:alpha/beta fold hydrolase n=1 Tax=Cohnella caldifontis TaxID=3027471 RepID=UPI0023EAD6AE|nr:alpha/beta hydrolase [Cohnella sp. YIM B05605]